MKISFEICKQCVLTIHSQPNSKLFGYFEECNGKEEQNENDNDDDISNS